MNGTLSLLNLLSDLAMAAGCLWLPYMQLRMWLRQVDPPFPTAYMLFAAVLAVNAATHVMDVLMLWLPAYYLNSAVHLMGAIVCMGGAIIFRPVVSYIGQLQGEVQRLHKERERA